MENRWSVRKNLTKLSLILFTVAFVLSMASMLTYAAGKAVIIEDSKSESTEEPEKAEVYSHTLDLKSVTEPEAFGDVVIRCPAMPSSDTVSIEQRYDKNIVNLTWLGSHGEYFLDNTPGGKMSHVKKLTVSDDGTSVTFSFSLDAMCICEAAFKNREVILDFAPIKEEERVVAVDAGHGGSSNGIMVGNLKEKDILIALADKIERLSKDRPYRVVLLRTGDYDLSDKERLSLCEKLGADYYLGLHATVDSSDERVYGMSAEYNGLLYREGISNAEFADCVLRNACLNVSNRGVELKDDYEDEILGDLYIPAAKLTVGYMSNKDEAALLTNGTYISKMAEGILDGLDEALRK
ncbi:MAG: N-acetylmuramoyl-L-alanine amidase [Lachnospiraceae bacterium]|nr:N-acetylmuramoyl-L-alanine amidase [Lachnospiraceae bacterium]